MDAGAWLEWTYRIAQEPRRLLPRYLDTNPRFMLGLARDILRERSRDAHAETLAPAACLRRPVSLVLGGRGFAGPHLVERLWRDGGVAPPSHAELDLIDAGAVPPRGLAGPAAVFHLAAFSSPRLSWEQPREALVTNIGMTLNVLEAVRAEAPGHHRARRVRARSTGGRAAR